MTLEIRAPRADEVSAFYARPLQYQMAFVDGEPVAVGGFTEHDGRLWAFLDVRDTAKVAGTSIVRAVSRALHQRNETVLVRCQAGEFPQAGRLLKLLGFDPTSEAEAGMQVWVWERWEL